MKFGYFDDKAKEYVITTPRTPFPWMNYLGHNEMLGLISHTGGGYNFYKDARLRRILRYRYNNIPLDMNGRYFYVKEGNDVWSPAWKPVMKDLDSFETRHGLGYTKIKGVKNGLESELTFFIPLSDTCEVHKAILKNTSNEKKKFSFYSFVEFCLYNALDDMTNFQRNFSTAEMEVEGSAIYHKTEYRERRDHYSFYSVNAPISGFDTDRDTFIGAFNTISTPKQVFEGTSGNSMASGWFPVASQRIDIELAPGETKELVYVLGFVINKPEEKWEKKGVINKKNAKALIEKYATVAAADAALAELAKHYENLFSTYQIESEDEILNRCVNIWQPYQCMITFNVSRSASGFESGIGRGMGFRDSNQDVMGAVSILADRCRQRILDLAATQFSNGSAYHQYQPLTKKGNADIGGGFNDDPLWLIFSTVEYIKETGDYSILDEKCSFDDKKSDKILLIDHLKQSVDFIMKNMGPHKLPLIGRADWNDCLNLNAHSMNPDESFQTCGPEFGPVAESVFIAGMFIKIVPDFIKICKDCKKESYVKGYDKAVEAMKTAVMKDGWDGEWFVRAYDAYGKKIGSKECEEGKIFIESQGMCVMAGIGAESGEAIKALDSVKKYLATDHGIKLQYPAYSEYHEELGEISSYPPGYKENAGIFTHNNSWIVISEALMGRGNEAYDYYKRVTTPFREEISDLHMMEPYVYPQMIAGNDAIHHGQAKNSWLTGTASWFYMAITQYIIGVRADWNGLMVKPALPDSLKKVTVKRRFRNAMYTIHIERTGTKSLKADKSKVAGDVVVYDPSVKEETIYCTI